MGTEEMNRNWSESDFKDYLSGRMGRDVQHRLEADLLDDPFLDEAFEGYKLAEGQLDRLSLDKKWAKMNSPSGSTSSSGGVGGPLLMGLLGAFVVVVIVTLYQKNEMDGMAESVRESIQETTDLKQLYRDSLEIMEIELAQVIEESEEIKPKETIKEQSDIVVFEEDRLERMSAPQPLDRLGPDSTDKQRERHIETPTPAIFYVKDLKLADYRPDYRSDHFLKGHFLTGTSARYESQKREMNQVAEIELVDYTGIMNDALSRFIERDYKNTLVILKRIEDKHPNDVNTAFYGGLCYYNLGKWNKADIRFRRAMNHPRKVFDQEAEWYLALSLNKQGKTQGSKAVLEGIVEKEGFYSKKARALLGL